MSNYHVIRTARLTDRQILQVIFAFKEEEQIENAIIGLGGNIQIDVATKERNEEDVAELDSDRHAIQSVTIVTSSAINISFHRGVSSNVQDPKASRQASPYFDELSLDPRRMEGYPESQQQFISCIDIIERALPRTVPLQEVDKGHTVIDVLQAEISGLADQYKAMLDGLAKEREEIRAAADEERQAARQAHDTAMKEAKAAAEEQKRQFDEYRKEQEAALAQRTNGLDERENDLDNRQHMHARRELREKISENFKERISKPVVSRTAKIMHWAVFVLTLGAGIYLGVQGLIDFNTLIETSSTEGFPGWLAAGWAFRSVVVLGVSIGFVAYAINWLRNVYLDDVRTRRQYERYGHDIDRASFVIETIMEVDGKEKTLVPDTWIEGVCRNLFRNNTDDTSDNPSANVAAMLLESISGAKIGPDGTEVSMDRRGVRRFAKKMPGGWLAGHISGPLAGWLCSSYHDIPYLDPANVCHVVEFDQLIRSVRDHQPERQLLDPGDFGGSLSNVALTALVNGTPIATLILDHSEEGWPLDDSGLEQEFLCSALAEFESELIRERTMVGLTVARTKGRKGGWKFALTQAAMARRDTSVSELCRELGAHGKRSSAGSDNPEPGLPALSVGVRRSG